MIIGLRISIQTTNTFNMQKRTNENDLIVELPNDLKEYKNELIATVDKCQDSFEKQLSYISAGCLALSIGFIKDIIKDIDTAQSRWLLTVGWILLGSTLLINLFSHLIAARLHYLTIKEINARQYDYDKTLNRISSVNKINWFSATTLVSGIFLIIIFVTLNF